MGSQPPHPTSPQSSVTSSRWRWGRECCVHAVCVVRAGREYKRVTLSGRVLCERFSTPFFFFWLYTLKKYRIASNKQTNKKLEQHKKNSNGYSSLELRRDIGTKGRNKNVAFERSAGTESHESVKNKSTKTKQETCHMKYPGFFFLFLKKTKQNKIVTYLYLSKKLNECFPLWYAF